MNNGMVECSVCHSKLVYPPTKAVSKAYDRYRSKVSSKQRFLNVLLVVGDCMLVGLQVYSSTFLFLIINFVLPYTSLSSIQDYKFCLCLVAVA